MNILILTHSYPDSENKWRGSFIKEQVKALSLKHEINLVYFKVDYSSFAPFSDYSFIEHSFDNITEYEVTICRSFPVINQLKYLTNTYRFINNEILSHKKIDIVNSHLSYPAGFLGTIIQIRKKIPNILTEHTWIRKYFRSWIHKKFVVYTLKKSEGIIAVSKALRDDIGQYCNRSIYVVPNVINVDKFPLLRTRQKHLLNIGILGGMGNFRKGLDILLKAVSLIKNMDLLVHIGGDGIYLDTFKKMSIELGVSEKCKFYGEILPSDLEYFYSNLDIFVLASRDETFGVVIVEAMSFGLPVIATKCGGPQEIVTKNTGILVEIENAAELAEAIANISDNLASYDKHLIREYAREKYGYEAFVNGISHIYQDVLDSEKLYK